MKNEIAIGRRSNPVATIYWNANSLEEVDGSFFRRIRPAKKLTISMTAKTKNRILAVSKAPATMPPKPKTAAIGTITKKTTE